MLHYDTIDFSEWNMYIKSVMSVTIGILYTALNFSKMSAIDIIIY